MKVAVTGASGLQGMSALIYLLEQDDVKEVQVSDCYNLDRLKERVDRMRDSRVRMVSLDCTDETAASRAFKGYDVVVNCAFTPSAFIRTTRAAMKAGAHYLDLTSAGEEGAQKELHEEFSKRGRTAIVDMGTAPGLSNVMAVYCMNKLDKVDSIDYKWAVVDVVPPEEHTRPLYWGYGIEGIMYLVSAPSWVWEDGQVKNLEPRARPERFRFKDPVGEQVIMGFPHPEPRMLAESFPNAGFKHIMYRQAFDPDSERKYCFLRDLGFHRLDPVDVKGVKVAPFDVLKTLLDQLPPERKTPAHIISEGNCIAEGWKDGKRMEVRLMIRTSPESEMHKRYTGKGAFGSYRTGICGAMAGVMLGRGLIEKKGVYPPELCIPAELYIREQVKVGMEVEETVTRMMND
jgi:lysine 6-dehydrogenase